jgi:hypothetical protein
MCALGASKMETLVCVFALLALAGYLARHSEDPE